MAEKKEKVINKQILSMASINMHLAYPGRVFQEPFIIKRTSSLK